MNEIKYRLWCKKCNNFTLHKNVKKENSEEEIKVCIDCNTEYTDVVLEDIPLEKLKEQRQRYKAWVAREYKKNLIKLFLASEKNKKRNKITFKEDEEQIYESDIGQRIIDEEIKKYSKLGRNDICICGSGLKYKKCCWKRIESY